jgi:uncharacterized membrane protein YhaH (DUF805 family)
MSFVDAITSVFRNYANFRGIATRPEFWYFTLLSGAIGMIFQNIPKSNDSVTSIVSTLQAVWSLGTLVPTLAVTARRFHDAGLSAKWLLLWIVPGIAIFSSVMTSVVALAQMLQDGNIQQAVMAIVVASIPAILLFLAVAVFQIVITTLPSKSAEAGNKHAV